MVVLYRFSYSAAPKAGEMRRRALLRRWSFAHNRNTQLHKNTLKEFTRGLFAQVREHHSCREPCSPTRSASCWLRMCTMLMPYTPPFSSTRRSHLGAAFCTHVSLSSYKLTVPTFGCALIDPTRSSVLLVKGFGRNRLERPPWFATSHRAFA
jgi:hypothetical protein